MAIYKYQQFLEHSNHVAFDQIHHPGQKVPHSGIYRCEGCGQSVAANNGDPLPPQNHHQHTGYQGAIRWKLTVATH